MDSHKAAHRPSCKESSEQSISLLGRDPRRGLGGKLGQKLLGALQLEPEARKTGRRRAGRADQILWIRPRLLSFRRPCLSECHLGKYLRDREPRLELLLSPTLNARCLCQSCSAWSVNSPSSMCLSSWEVERLPSARSAAFVHRLCRGEDSAEVRAGEMKRTPRFLPARPGTTILKTHCPQTSES